MSAELLLSRHCVTREPVMVTVLASCASSQSMGLHTPYTQLDAVAVKVTLWPVPTAAPYHATSVLVPLEPRVHDTVAKPYVDMCSALGGLSYSSEPTDASKAQPGGQGAAAASSSGTSGQAAGNAGADGKPAEPQKKPGTTEKIKETTDKLKKFLKF